MTELDELRRRIDELTLALNARVEKLERRADWAERHHEAIENALVASLCECIDGQPGPNTSQVHIDLCQRCAALAELEDLDDEGLEGGPEGQPS